MAIKIEKVGKKVLQIKPGQRCCVFENLDTKSWIRQGPYLLIAYWLKLPASISACQSFS